MENVNFRPCGDCAACCEGHLIGKSHGNSFGLGKKCIFLVKQECTIYEERPEVCRKYHCMWKQGLFSEWMKPNKSGVIISAKWENGKQYLEVVEISREIDYNVYEEVKSFCMQNNIYYKRVSYDSIHTQL